MTKPAERYVEEEVAHVDGSGRLWVFDFDNTLVRTGSRVGVTKADGTRLSLTTAEFALYGQDAGDDLDFSEFRCSLIDPRPVAWMTRILRAVRDRHGPRSAVVLSARDVAGPVEEYMAGAGLGDVEVVVVGNRPHAKASWIRERILRDDLEAVEFFDDTLEHVSSVRRLALDITAVRIVARHVAHNRSSSLERC